MLGWAMSDLARASGLSLSTIRRLEHDAQAVSPRNRLTALHALQTGGMRFMALEDGSLALLEPRSAVDPAGDVRVLATARDRRPFTVPDFAPDLAL